MPLPFEEENDQLSEHAQKVGLKNVSSQKSMFDKPKKTSHEEFKKTVQNIQEKDLSYKTVAAELTSQYKTLIADKTLKQNKSIFSSEIEQELLKKMMDLAMEMNDDTTIVHNDMGSLSWIILLLKTCLFQRDQINNLEYQLSRLLDTKKNNV